MANFITPGRAVRTVVAAGDKLSTYSEAKYRVEKVVKFTNAPDAVETVFEGVGANTTAAFADDTEVTIRAGEWGLSWDTDTDPVALDHSADIAALAALRADPAAYSETAADIAAVLVALGVMEEDAGAG